MVPPNEIVAAFCETVFSVDERFQYVTRQQEAALDQVFRLFKSPVLMLSAKN
jgi:hypothetical protein